MSSLMMSGYFGQKIWVFLPKIVPLLKAILWELFYSFLSSVFSFCKIKGYCQWKYRIYRVCIQNLALGLLQIAHDLKNDNEVTIFWHEIIITFFWGDFVSLVKFSYWSKFHGNIIVGVMTSSYFVLFRIYQKLGNRKYPCLNFSQYLETGES